MKGETKIMAKEKTEAVETPAVQQEPVYDAAEIAANSKRLFGYGVDLATAAFDYNKVNACTIEEAKRLIQEFAERRV